MPHWAKLHDKCRSCGTMEKKHLANGLCVSCYTGATEKRQKSHITRRIGTRLANPITKEELEQRYQSGQSLNDIARQYNCTRQYIHKLMQRYRIVRRSNQESRILSIEQGKVVYASQLHSPGSGFVLQRRTVDESFFKTWTPAMAWVLGVIYTDGCLHKRSGAVGSVSIAQKEPELLMKVLVLMKSNAKIAFSPKRGIAGALYEFRIHNAGTYADLQRLGLTPTKSLTLQFPDIPPDYVRHFIRGCWDGDGSVYFEKEDLKPCASYVSGSKDFIERLVGHLVNLGLPDRTIHTSGRSENPSYYFRYTGGQCAKLYRVLYDHVDSSMYLSRKHDAFKKMADQDRNQNQIVKAQAEQWTTPKPETDRDEIPG
jgi:hypothetical protein